MLTNRNHILVPQPDNIPQVLKDAVQWANWRAESSKDKPGTLDKVPYCAKNTRRKASHSDPATWADYMAAYDAWRLHGEPPIDGLLFACGNNFGGIDIDNCIDPQTGEIAPFAWEVIRAINSYTEKSVSGTGVRIFVRMPEAKGTKQGPIEIYSTKRFLSVTGHHVQGTPVTVEERGGAVEQLRRGILEQRAKAKAAKSASRASCQRVATAAGHLNVDAPNVTALGLSDDDVLAACRGFRNFEALWRGDTSGYDSASNADMALAGLLAFACGPDEHERVERLMRRSGLYRADKWDRPDYLPEFTIPAAYRDRTEYYSWPGHQHPDASDSADPRPTVQMGPETDTILRELEKHLALHLYQRAGQLVEVRLAEPPQPLDDVRRKCGTLMVEDVPVEQVQRLMSRHVRFTKPILAADANGKRRRSIQKIAAPPALAKLLVGCGSWSAIPPLVGITDTPFMRRDGRIVSTPGHDPASGYLFVSTDNVDWPAIPSRPTPGQVQAAVDLLLDVICDFPFAAEPHRSAWLAGLFTVLARPAIHGPVPLLWIDSPRAGTGKTKLANVIGLVANGRGATELSFTSDDKELENRLGSLLLAGDRFAFFDNATGSVRNPTLDRFLTSTYFGFRRFFQQKIAKPRNTATLALTGNNLTLRGDLARRVIRARFVAELERPEKRSGFRHPDLEGYVQENRPALVAAALTILRAHAVTGFRVHQGVAPLGSYSEWEQVVRHAILTAGLPDPVATQEEVHDDDDDSANLLAVLAAWHDFNPRLIGTTNEIVDAAVKEQPHYGDPDAGRFRMALKELTGVPYDSQPCPKILAYRFRDAKDKRINGYRVVKAAGRTKGGNHWQVIYDGPLNPNSIEAQLLGDVDTPQPTTAPTTSPWSRPNLLRRPLA